MKVTAENKNLTYIPYPTAVKFHKALDKRYRFMAGPPGSGKSVTNFMELLAIAMRQEPAPDKNRYTRFAVIRKTYGELEETTLNTMKAWLSPKVYNVVNSRPIKMDCNIPLPDGTRAIIEFRLIAIDTNEDLDKLDSSEYTAIWLNELTGLPKDLVGKAGERAGRYPPSNLWDDGKSHVTYRGVIADYNYPPKDHWIVDFLHEGGIEESPQIADAAILFEQPPAILDHVDDNTGEITYELNLEAENLVNLDDGKKYLDDLAMYQATGSYDKIQTRLLCRYGKAGGDGKPVINNFDRERHVAEDRLEPLKMTDTLISFDTSGIHPCCLFWQYIRGKWQIIDGMYGEEMGLEEFIDDVLTPVISMRYNGCRIVIVCDPADARDGRSATSPTSLLTEKGYRAEKAITNRFKDRKNAQEVLLNREGKGSVVISPHLTMLIDALDGGYQYRQLKVSGIEKKFSTEPLKNKYSHWCDAMQYGSLYILNNVMSDEAMNKARRLAKNSAARLTRGR